MVDFEKKQLKQEFPVPFDDFIITVYLRVSAYFLSTCPPEGLRSRGRSPELSDEELMTIEIIGEYLELGSDKAIWRYTRKHLIAWFPKLPCRTGFVRQSANLHGIKQAILQQISQDITAGTDIYLGDGFPLPICHIRRYKRSKNPLHIEAAASYCAAKDEHYFGFKGHLIVTQDGAFKGFELTAANIDERDIVPEITAKLTGDLIADKGLIRPQLKDELRAQGLHLHTPLRKNMRDNRPKALVSQIMNIRRKVETVIGQLVERFNIQRIKAKDLWHLNVKITRKLLAHAMCFLINKDVNPDNPLQFDKLCTN